MPMSAHILRFCGIGLLACGLMACNHVPHNAHRLSLLRAQQLYKQSNSLAQQKHQAEQSLQALASERETLMAQNQQLRQQAAAYEDTLNTANERLRNLQQSQSDLQHRFASMMNSRENQPSPLSQESTRRFEELAQKYPGFEFDPDTGVSQFGRDILFDSGSAQLKKSAIPILKEFADIMTDGDSNRLNVLVVGHTDDQPIAKPSTRSKHPTNWHLSTDRAVSVALTLGRYGIGENRMGAAGYSMYQPRASNESEQGRQMNRRVEIYVLAPNAPVAGRDDGAMRR